MSMNIIAIGGGELRELETLRLDELIVRETGKPNPVALFIPTASDDSERYCDTFHKVYRDHLGCRTNVLLLIQEETDTEQIKEKISRADLIYVGGGNSRRMLEVWRQREVDQMLISAAGKGTILSGLSAGAICWFRTGNSDAPMIEGADGIKTISISGLGLVPLALCPHMQRESFRRKEFTAMMRTTPGIGVGLDDNCAIHIRGDDYKIIASAENSCAYRIWWQNGQAFEERLPADDIFRPIASLLCTRLPQR